MTLRCLLCGARRHEDAMIDDACDRLVVQGALPITREGARGAINSRLTHDREVRAPGYSLPRYASRIGGSLHGSRRCEYLGEALHFTTMLPAMTLAEAIETMRIHCVTGLIGDRTVLVMMRPCHAPHHTSSDVGRIGGSHVPMPGEGSLVHHGVLILRQEFICVWVGDRREGCLCQTRFWCPHAPLAQAQGQKDHPSRVQFLSQEDHAKHQEPPLSRTAHLRPMPPNSPRRIPHTTRTALAG
jgi:hypothetical protein